MVQDQIHKAICYKIDEVSKWFAGHREGLDFLVYSSFDLRDSGDKICPVDANIFPAGFNNICQADKETAVSLVEKYLKDSYPDVSNHIAIVTEEHTSNAYYWENVHTLKNLIEEAGYQVSITFPRTLDESFEVTSVLGNVMKVSPGEKDNGSFFVNGEKVDLIINNNDFSDQKEQWVEDLKTPMNPPYDLGWHKRRKDSFFNQYNQLATEFAEVIGVDSNYFTVRTEKFSNFDITDEDSREKLAGRVDEFLAELKAFYAEHSLEQDPFVFVKNNSGTYGLGVTSAASGDDIRSWNNKARKKMKAVKGGGDITEVIIQEGIPSRLDAEGATSEPAIYMIGCQLTGGFLRVHGKKGPTESLNSPGAVYKRLCITDLSINVEGCPMENVYGWVARLGALALAKEARAAGVTFPGKC